ncbi:MAG: outer membrane lipoprotein-sorting protein [bacterium]|nr:outer membrane lipoprotein-sorting protein [bacterium]
MRISRAALAAATLLAATSTLAAPPDAATLAAKMKAALEPQRASVRSMTLTISGIGGPGGVETVYTAVQARKSVDGRARMLTAIVTPPGERGIASLVEDGDKTHVDVVAVWLPMIRRVRTLTPLGQNEAFLGSDFTYADLGLVDMKGTYTVGTATEKNGTKVWELQVVPPQHWYYSKVVAFLDQTTLLPIERNYYDPSGHLWKVETFSDVTVVDGTPVAFTVRMEDRESKSWSTMVTKSVKFDVDLPDALFTNDGLPTALESPALKGVE